MNIIPTIPIAHLRRAGLTLLVFVAANLCMASPSSPADVERSKHELPSERSTADLQAIYAAMDRQVIQDKTFTDTSAREILEFLKQASIEGNSAGFNLVASFPGVPPKLSLHWKQLTWRQALDAFCAKAGLHWRIGIRAIEIKP